ncbi:MAG: ABC transporter ATP-binding protein [Actinomycetota bacterium]|nr:ABC transporter ATP-binding protein [Actinomycetota bacterium]
MGRSEERHAARGTPAVELIAVRKYFDAGAIKALDGLDLSVARGESVAVSGPSGCGKSTMLHLIAALDTPTSGMIRVGGQDISLEHDLARYRRAHIGLVFQLHHLLAQLSARQNVEISMFGTGQSSRKRRERARSLLADVGLSGSGERSPTRLSGGERQRVAIARALANSPELLLADEPTGSLDEASVDLILELFKRLRAERPELTIILVTHDARVAASADRIVALRYGRVEDDDLGRHSERPAS